MKNLILTWCLIYISIFSLLSQEKVSFSFGKEDSTAHGETQTVIPYSKFWKYHTGNDTSWSQINFNDSNWDTINPELIIDSIPKNFFTGSCWFRAKVLIDSVNANKILGIDFSHNGASEIYYDGKLIQRYGKVSGNKESEESHMPNFPLLFASGNTGQHLIAIRYSNHKFLKYHSNDYKEGKYAGISMEFIENPNDSIDQIEILKYINLGISVLFGFFLALSIVHLLLFLFYRQKKQNLYYSIFTFSFALLFIVSYLNINATNPAIIFYVSSYINYVIIIHILALIKFLHSLFNPKKAKTIFIIGCVLALMCIITNYYLKSLSGLMFSLLFLLGVVEYIRSIIVGFKRIKIASKIIGSGSLIVVGILIVIAIAYYFFNDSVSFSFVAQLGKMFLGLFILIFLIILFPFIAIPISMSFYLAYDFSLTNKNLRKKLIEVEDLSEKTMLQEKEKQEILSQQKEKLELQVAERTREVVEQKNIIEEKSKDIIDSIVYAKRIQSDLLPSDELISNSLPDSFILYKPKDIVSGDFYWFAQKDEYIFIAVVDCTGHGVPGAFMSVIGHNFLNQIVNEMNVTDTAEILNELHKKVRTTLSKEKGKTTDGMDVALLSINQVEKKAQFSGAARPLFYFDKEGFHEIKRDHWSIGGVIDFGSSFGSVTISLNSVTAFYLFSDGYVDQFSSEDKKLMTGKFKEILLSIQDKSMEEQKHYLDTFIENWKGNMEQTDDILVIGIRI